VRQRRLTRRRVKLGDPTVLAKAKEWFQRFQSGHIDRSQLDGQVNAALTAKAIQSESARLKALGRPAGFLSLSSEVVKGAVGYDFLITFAAAKVLESIAVNSRR
jgi:hypothetical protein